MDCWSTTGDPEDGNLSGRVEPPFRTAQDQIKETYSLAQQRSDGITVVIALQKMY